MSVSRQQQRLRIYAFVEGYPSAYKPYYDAQFLDLLRKGHDLTVFSVGSPDPVPNEKLMRSGLDRRIRPYFPEELRRLPSFMPQIVGSLLAEPVSRLRIARRLLPGVSLRERVRRTARMATLPVEAPDFCLVHGLGPMSWLSWLRALYPGTPVAFYYHGEKPRGAGAIPETQVTAAFRGADLVFTNTEFSRRRAIVRGAEPARTRTLPVGFDLDDYKPGARSYRRDGKLHLVSVGRLSDEKGHIFALQALAELARAGFREVDYAIVGNGYLRPSLEEFVASNGLDDIVRFTGTLPNLEVISLLGRSDALLLPSIAVGGVEETQAAVVQEALLMEAVVITTRVGGVPESTPAELHTFSVPPESPPAMADAILRLAHLAPDELREMARRGRTWAEEHYDISGLNDRMLQEITFRAGSAAPAPISPHPARQVGA